MFNVSCNSHYLSHFAASFIDIWAEWSTAKNFFNNFLFKFAVQKQQNHCLKCDIKIVTIAHSESTNNLQSTLEHTRTQQVRTHTSRLANFFPSNALTSADANSNNDPSAGSPTETLLRLLLPLNDQVWSSSKYSRQLLPVAKLSVRLPHWTIQSVVATGGVYKGQGRNQRKLMTCAYWEFLVQGKQLQFPIPSTSRVQRITSTFRTWI